MRVLPGGADELAAPGAALVGRTANHGLQHDLADGRVSGANLRDRRLPNRPPILGAHQSMTINWWDEPPIYDVPEAIHLMPADVGVDGGGSGTIERDEDAGRGPRAR